MNGDMAEGIASALEYKAKMEKTVEALRGMVSRSEGMNELLNMENMHLRIGLKDLRYKLLSMIHDQGSLRVDCQIVADDLFNVLYPESKEKR